MAHYVTGVTRFDYSDVKNWLFRWFPVLLLAGNFKIWIGASSITLPVPVLLLAMIVVTDLVAFRTRWSAKVITFVLSYVVLIAIGLLLGRLDHAARIGRSLASLLPYFSGLLVLIAFKDATLPQNPAKEMVFAGVVLSLLVAACFAFVFVPTMLNGGQSIMDHKVELVLPLGPSNFLAVMLMFFSIYAWRDNKIAWMVVLLAAALTLSRFGVAFTLLAAVATACTRRIPILVLGVTVFSLSVVVVLALALNGSGMFAPVVNGVLPISIEARAELWALAANLIVVNPLSPASPGGFTSYLEWLSWPRAEWGTHNFVLSLWIEFGLLGLLLYLAILVLVLTTKTSMESRDERTVKLSVIFVYLYATVENVVEVASFQLLFAYLISLAIAQRRQVDE